MRPSLWIRHVLLVPLLGASLSIYGLVFLPPIQAQVKWTAELSNLVATTDYQSQATLNAYKERTDSTIRGLRLKAETARSKLGKLQRELKASKGLNASIKRKLEQAQKEASDAQTSFTKELANRDQLYARQRQRIINSATSLLITQAGRKFLELKNEGSSDSWEQAKIIAQEELLTRRSVLAAEYRNIAVQYNDQRVKGLESATAVIALYEEVVKLDEENHWDFVELTRLYLVVGDLPKAYLVAQRTASTAASDRDKAVALTELGDVAFEQGRLVEANQSYATGLLIMQRLIKANPLSTAHQRDLAIGYSRLGDVAMKQGKLSEARRSYTNGLAIRQRLVETTPDNMLYRHDLSLSYRYLGRVARRQGELDEALSNYAKGLEITEQLIGIAPDNSVYQRDLSNSYSNMGDVARRQGKLEQALNGYVKGLTITQRLIDEDPSNREYKRDLDTSYRHLGYIVRDSIGMGDDARLQGELEKARGNYARAFGVIQRLVQVEPGNIKYQRDLGVSLSKLAAANAKGFSWRRAYKHFKSMKDKGDLSPLDESLLETARTNAGRK